MKIKISKQGDKFEVDPVQLPGSPSVGRGKTLLEALGDFLIHYQEKLGIEIEVDDSAKQAAVERHEEADGQR